MTQLNLVTSDGVPYGVTLALQASPIDPQLTLVDVRVYNKRKEVIASYGGRWKGAMPEWLPRLAEEVVLAYLFAEGARDVVRAATKVAASARANDQRRQLHGYDQEAARIAEQPPGWPVAPPRPL